MKLITCQRCGIEVEAHRKTKKYCGTCVFQSWKDLPPIERDCRWCGKHMTLPRGGVQFRVMFFCCPEHSVLSAKKSRIESQRRAARGEPRKNTGRKAVLTPEEQAQRRKQGIVGRFFRNNPDRLPVCQSCGENRIVELAHKTPRNGAWRSFKNTQNEDIWVLCPTCHRCLDRGVQTAEELGLE